MEVKQKIWDAGYYVDMDFSDHKITKKVRDAQLAQYNFILVIGQKEADENTVNVRTRDNVVHGERTIDQLLLEFKDMVDNHQ